MCSCLWFLILPEISNTSTDRLLSARSSWNVGLVSSAASDGLDSRKSECSRRTCEWRKWRIQNYCLCCCHSLWCFSGVVPTYYATPPLYMYVCILFWINTTTYANKTYPVQYKVHVTRWCVRSKVASTNLYSWKCVQYNYIVVRHTGDIRNIISWQRRRKVTVIKIGRKFKFLCLMYEWLIWDEAWNNSEMNWIEIE